VAQSYLQHNQIKSESNQRGLDPAQPFILQLGKQGKKMQLPKEIQASESQRNAEGTSGLEKLNPDCLKLKTWLDCSAAV
jgi:hypothetical protein